MTDITDATVPLKAASFVDRAYLVYLAETVRLDHQESLAYLVAKEPLESAYRGQRVIKEWMDCLDLTGRLVFLAPKETQDHTELVFTQLSVIVCDTIVFDLDNESCHAGNKRRQRSAWNAWY